MTKSIVEAPVLSTNDKIFRYINRLIPQRKEDGTTYLTPHTAPEPSDPWGWIAVSSHSIRQLQKACDANELDFYFEVREALNRHLIYIGKAPQREAKRRESRLKRIMAGNFFMPPGPGRQELDELEESAREFQIHADDASFLKGMQISIDGFESPTS